ncbi:MAG: NUDIX hydrolase [Sarcina sp.]
MTESIRNKNGYTEAEFLADYDINNYERPSVTVDMVLFTLGEIQKDRMKRKVNEKELKVLLVKRGEHPCINKWSLPGGFVHIDESLEEGVNRKLKEETGLDNIYCEQLYTWGDVGRDPRTRIISTSYMALVNSEVLNSNENNDWEVAWFSVKKEDAGHIKVSNEEQHYKSILIFYNEILDISIRYKMTEKIKIRNFDKEVDYEYEIMGSRDELAFDHLKIIYYALERMRNKVQYTAIVFSLLPKLFTLTELQQVYEILLGRKLIKSNFRRWVNKLVEETDKTRKGGAHRPSRLFTLKADAIMDGVINI